MAWWVLKVGIEIGDAMKRSKKLVGRCSQLGIYLCIASLAHGQSVNPPPSADTALPPPPGSAAPAPGSNSPAKAPAGTGADAATATMDTIVVQAVPLEEQVVPTARPISSVYGQDMGIVDIPRSVNIITKQQLEDRQITSVQDLGQFASGTYSPAEYGLDGIPFIRGVFASLYQNGQQEVFYRNSVVPSFNQVESLDLVKGPGSATYGPPGGGPGGYVNFITKVPEFDSNHTEIETTIGDYSPGGQSWGHYEWTIDNTGPLIANKLAYRFSYEGTTGDTYYRNTVDEKQDFFGALTWLPYDALKMDWTFQYYTVRDNEVPGFTRPTQDLIDNGQYTTGPQAYPFGPVVSTGTQKVYAYESLNGYNSSTRGSKLSTQLITNLNLADDLTLTNYQFFQRLESRKYEAYGYDEYVPGVDLYDTRTELHYDWNFKFLGQDVANHDIGGFAFRGQQGTQFSDFSIEPYNAFDITKDPSTFTFTGAGYGFTQIGGTGFGGYPIKGMPGYSAGLYGFDGTNFTTGNTGQYAVYDANVFYQHTTDWGKYVTTLFGARGDYTDAYSRIPTQYLEDYTGSDEGSGTRVLNYNVFASVIGHITPDASVYATFDRTHGFQGDPNFGGLVAGPNQVTPGELRNQSDLYEIGYKQSMFNSTLYYDVDFFYQTRDEQVTGVGDPIEQVQSNGIETDVAYQPNKNFDVTGNFTWLEANYHQIADAFQDTGSPIDTGTGTPNFATFPTGNYRLPGTPNLYFNLFATYKFDNGFGFGLGPQVQSGQNADLTGQLKIPAQFTWNGNIFYRQKTWEVQLNFFNFTDERNFTSTDPTFEGNDAILEQVPFAMSGTFKYRF
jgi:outer membrane receptor for ferric coprogen and ferric-rhodotorulic acid